MKSKEKTMFASNVDVRRCALNIVMSTEQSSFLCDSSRGRACIAKHVGKKHMKR
jgi:hypothetical protein